MRLAKLLLVFLLLVLTPSISYAGVGTFLSTHNDEIDQELRDTIRAIANKVIESIKKNEPSVMLDLFMEEVRRQKDIESNTKKLYEQLREVVKEREFKQYNEYHVVLKKVGTFNPMIPSETEDRFTMLIQGKSNQLYVALLRSDGDLKDLLFSFIYMKEKDQWRLQTFHAGVIGVAGKTALEWFEEAKALSEKGYHMPVLLRLQIAASCLRPAPFIEYEKEEVIIALINEARGALGQRDTLSIRLPEVETEPEIYYIEPQFVQTELLPLIKYVTKIPLDDVPALQKEVDAITRELESLFPGITKGVSHVIYKAFSEPPTDPTKQYLSYGLTVEIE